MMKLFHKFQRINPNKATGSDGISGQMLLLCDESVILHLQIIFTNIMCVCVCVCVCDGHSLSGITVY